MTFNLSRKISILALSVLANLLSAETIVSGNLSSDTEWSKKKSPYIVTDDIIISEGIGLTIEPGTEVRFKKSVSIITKGDLFAAGEEGNEIIFCADNPNEPWGGIRLVDTRSSYGEFLESEAALKKGKLEVVKFAGKQKNYNSKLEYTEGTIFTYCIFENAGTHKRPSSEILSKVYGALVCNNTAPYVENCTFRNNSFPKGGALSVLYYSAPLVKNCNFYNNTTDQGGAAIYCFFFSSPIITGNIIRDNFSKENGGGILSNSSMPLIKDNIIFRNKTPENGGGLALLASEATLINNQIRNNIAVKLANGIYIGASKTSLDDNLLLNDGLYDVAIGKGDSSVTTSNCYWGLATEDYVSDRVFDIEDSPLGGEMILKSAAKFPSPKLPYFPSNIHNLKLKYDRSYTTDLSIDLSQDFPMFIQAEANGGSPFYRDIITVKISSSKSDPEGLHVQLVETDTASNIYRGEAVVKGITSHPENFIAGQVGEKITLTIDQNPKTTMSFIVQEKVPYVTACKIDAEKNQQRIVSHNPVFKWNYEDLRKKPQKAVQIQIGSDKDWAKAEVYDSKEVKTDNYSYQPASLILDNGTEYFYRIRVSNGERWSGWLETSFRMNDVTVPPLAIAPKNNIILNKDKVELSCSEVTDPDNDTLKYVFEISESSNFSGLYESSDFLLDTKWKNSKSLKDNAHYFWQVKVFDGYGYSDYMAAGNFWINTSEENPEEPQLSEPANKQIAYSTKPNFVWQDTSDPDPLSEITYTLAYGTDRGLNNAVTKKDLKSSSFTCTEDLKHGAEYFWRVTAADQTGRKTASQVYSFTVDTKPSVPQLSNAGEELKPTSEVSWSASTDPQQGDQVYYTLQISKSKDFKAIVLTQDRIKETSIVISRLTEQRLLSDDESYYFRVKSTDNHGISSAYSEEQLSVFNRENNRPDAVLGGFIPKNDEVTATTSPEVKFDPAKDRDRTDSPETMIYEAQFSKDGKFGAESKSFTGQKGFNSVRAENLDDDDKWFWRVRAIDDDGAKSEWSKSSSFIINVLEDNPTTFALLSPEKEAKLYELNTINFRWEASKDKDYGSSVDYSFHIAKNSDFSDQKSIPNLKNTTYTLNDNLENERTYYWKVIAKDNNGNVTESPLYNFTVNSTPTIPDLNPLDGKERTTTDQLTWQKSKDPDPRDQVSYIVQISESASFDRNTVTSSRINMTGAAGGDMVKNIDKNNRLMDNVIYYWHVQAVDNRGNTSDFSGTDRFFFNRVNNAPQIVSSELAPVENDVLHDEKITLKWLANDPDLSDPAKVLKAQVQIDENHFKTNMPSFDIPTNPGQFSITKKLEDNKIYSWRVKAYDDENKGSEWSKVAKFTVNTKEDAPQPFSLTEPVYGKYYDLKMNFKWERTTDKDPQSSVNYRFELATDAQFGNIVETEVLNTTNYSTKKLLNNATTYFWRVIAVDNTGLETICQKQFSFIINSTPTVPDLNNRNEEEINPEAGKFQWSNSKDPNPKDQIYYELEVASDDDFGSVIASKRDLRTTVQTAAGWKDLEKLPDNQYYYARVRAKDQNNFASNWSKTIKFILNRVNDAPDQPVITSPDNGDVLNSGHISIAWQMLNDIDVNDKPETLKPEIQISKTQNFEVKNIKQKINAPSGKNSCNSEKLADNSKYFIRMRAADKKGKFSKWSDVIAVTVNTADDAPTDFKVMSPKGKFALNTKAFNFRWEKATDPDPDSEVRYTLYLSTDKNFSSATTRSFENINSNSHNLNEQLPPSSYYWKVEATDNTGKTTRSKNIENFIVPKK